MRLQWETWEDVRSLALVRRDNSDLLTRDTGAEEVSDDLLHHGRFGAVQVAGAARRDFLSALHKKRHKLPQRRDEMKARERGGRRTVLR